MGITLAGVFIHLKLHPPWESLYYFWASPLSVFSLIVIPVLYSRPATSAWGFMLNAVTVLIGTTGMSYYSLLYFERPFTLYRIITESTLPAIFILWARLPVAYLILVKMQSRRVPLRQRGCVE